MTEDKGIEQHPLIKQVHGNNIVCLRAEGGETKTKSGIYLLDPKPDAPSEGYVVGIGPGKWDSTLQDYLPIDVELGDHVLYRKYAAAEYQEGLQEDAAKLDVIDAGMLCFTFKK